MTSPADRLRAWQRGVSSAGWHDAPQAAHEPSSPPPSPAVWVCGKCGAELDEACEPILPGCPVDEVLVTWRLEQAGATLLAMRIRSPAPPACGSGWPDVVHDAMVAYGWDQEPTRAAIPDAAAISAMDRAYAWLRIIPRQRYVLRRIIAARSLVHPVTGRHVLSWRRVARLMRCDHHSVEGWHAQGIALIVEALRRG